MSPGRVLNSMRMFSAFDCSHESQRSNSNLWAGKSLNSCLLLAVFIPVWLRAVCDAVRGEGDGKRQQSHFFYCFLHHHLGGTQGWTLRD